MVEQFPVYIPTRDRLTPLLEVLSWLESVGQHEVYLVDNSRPTRRCWSTSNARLTG